MLSNFNLHIFIFSCVHVRSGPKRIPPFYLSTTGNLGSTSSQTKVKASLASLRPALASLGLSGANICTATTPVALSRHTRSLTTPSPTPPPPADPPPRSASTPAPAPPRRSPPGGCASRPTGPPRLSSHPQESLESSRLSTDLTSSD